MILHVPHSSTVIPEEIRSQFLVSDEVLKEEIRVMTDHYTAELFSSGDFPSVIASVSRVCVDVERFIEDSQETMSQKGMGCLYTHGHDGTRIRRDLIATERQRLLDEFYVPHHNRLEKMVEKELEKSGKCLIIDCHSFPGKPFPYEDNQSLDRPDICIGTDSYHTPEFLTEKLVSLFEGHGLKVAVDTPFTGALVPGRFYESSKEVSSALIEVQRSLYMNEVSAVKSEGFEQAQKVVKCVLEALKDEFSQVD